ncbi:MAG: extracellular solute-binding protein [Rhodobacter sp.]|nr:extracellular solute-binding protein [Rhodobacter sp.]MCY4168091.1 extracellular solute-binding protein [Rhodobacter sp.]
MTRNHLLAGAMTLLSLLGTSAATAEPLVIYSPQGDERAVWIAERADAAGHDVTILTSGGGELFDRILAERANPQADVVLGLIDAAMATLKAEGLFQPYVPNWAEGLPEVYRDDTDRMVYKFWQTPVVIAYNSDMLAEEDAPTSWLELVEDRYAGKYVIGPTIWQTTKTYLIGMLLRFADESGEISDEGWDFMQSLYDNAIVVDSADAKTAAFVNKEAVIDLNWFGGVGRLADDVGYRAVMVDTEGGTPFIAEGIAIMEGTDQLDDAKAFVDWFGSAEFMSAYAARFGQVPVHPDAIAAAPDTVKRNATLLRPQPIDWDVVAPRVDGWIQRIELDIK